MKDNVVKRKSFEFAVSVTKCCHDLCRRKEYVLSKQLLRSGTSIGSNVREAANSNGTKDFAYRMSVALRECDETMFWLEVLHASGTLSKEHFENLHAEAKELIKLLTAIVKTVRSSIK